MNKNSKKVALKFATFAALFGVMSFFMDMMEENEEQITYSVTLESLALGNGETDGENGGGNGGGGADGGTTGGGNGGDTTEGEVTLWTRNDQDCVYKITGKANAEVKFLGITIKLNAEGEAEYVYSGGKTHCIAGGNEQCRARYCPTSN